MDVEVDIDMDVDVDMSRVRVGGCWKDWYEVMSAKRVVG